MQMNFLQKIDEKVLLAENLTQNCQVTQMFVLSLMPILPVVSARTYLTNKIAIVLNMPIIRRYILSWRVPIH